MFLLAIAELISATLASFVPSIAVPLVIVPAVPLIWVGFVEPIILIGGLKFAGKLPPPLMENRPLPPPPEVFIVTGDVRLVWLLVLVEDEELPKPNDGCEEPIVVRRSVKVSSTLVT